MKRTAALAAAALMLTACTGNNETSDILQYEYLPAEQLYSGLDAALETEYTKFTLPERSQIPVLNPEGIYELRLGYVNTECSVDWLKEKVDMLYEALGFEFGGRTVVDGYSAYRKDESNDVSMLGFSQTYCRWENTLNGVSMLNENIISYDTLFYDRSPAGGAGEAAEKLADRAIQIADKISGVTGDELDNTVSDICTLHTDTAVGYEIGIRKSYKGIGIQDLFSSHITDTETSPGNDLLAVSMQSYIDLDSDLGPEYYVGCNSYNVQSADKLEKAVSFRSACDILERELAEYVRFKFDTVMLMYEPRGKALSSEMTAPETVSCVPKWFFISDSSSQSGSHSIDYVTVDCRDGSVEVEMP